MPSRETAAFREYAMNRFPAKNINRFYLVSCNYPAGKSTAAEVVHAFKEY
jgi:ABC-type branched-subunit amino acid transport system substrate-binding protein